MLTAAGEGADLIPGAAEIVRELRSAGLKIGSSTGYTREMMGPVLTRAAEQGYAPTIWSAPARPWKAVPRR